MSPASPAPAREPDELRIARYLSEKSNRPELYTCAWSDVVTMLKTHQLTICTLATCTGKDCPNKFGRGFSFAEQKRGTTRANEHVIRIHAAVFDIDKITREQARAILSRLKASGLACVLSSTHSHRPGAPRLRLVILLSRPATVVEWPALWGAINAALALNADLSAQDPSRLYFEPTCPSDVKPIAWSQDGEPLDVDLYLLDAPAPQPERRAPLSGEEWIDVLGNLGEGNRDVGLTRVGGVLFRNLPARLAEALLHAANARFCVPPLDEDQVRKIAGSLARREQRSV